MANYVYNSASSGEKYNAKCLNVSDDSEWTPSAAEYPEDGTIDLSGGTSGRYLDTQWIAPQDTEWTMSGIYNVVMGVSYDMYSIHYKGNQTCDIYLGSNTEDLVLSESDKDYTPPTGNWIIEEEPPSIIINDPYGPELLPPLADPAWFGYTGWTVVGETFEVSTTTATYNGPRVAGVCEVGKFYKVEFTISEYVSGTCQAVNPFNGTTYSNNVTLSSEEAEAGFVDFKLRDTSANCVYTVSNISCKEVL